MANGLSKGIEKCSQLLVALATSIGRGSIRFLKRSWRTLSVIRRAVAWWWRILGQQPGRGWSILIAVVLAVSLILGLVLRLTKPLPTFVVSPFETSTVRGTVSISGKTVANLFVDELQQLIKESSNEVAVLSPDSSKLEPIRFSPGLRPTAVGIEVGGFSVQRIVAEWDRVRQQQYQITGDLLIAGGTALRIRLLTDGSWWEERTDSDTVEDLKSMCKRLAFSLISDLRPDIAGLSYYRQQEFEQARNLFEQWVKARPRQAEPYFYLGLAHQGTGDYGAARDAYKRALAINPQFTTALVVLATNLLEVAERDEEFEQIIDYYQRALRLDPNLDEDSKRNLAIAHTSLGLGLQAKGQNESANRHFAEAKRLGVE